MLTEGMYIADRYEILGKVGAGGMSDVYKAKDLTLGRFVAIKVLKAEFSEDINFVTKFRSEAQAAAGLEHPNIVNIYDVGSENGLHYIVMEYVEGITLKTYIEKKGQLSFKEAVSIAIQVGRGIEAAHNKNIVHRDIKPQNIMISTEGKVKVTDFGIARAATSNTISSDVMGSVHYSSPEQARNGFVDGKSDIYSLGIVMYEMVTGRVPFDGDTTVAVAIQHLQEEIVPPSVYAPNLPISMEKIILKCTQKNPDRRYASMTALLADLRKALISPNEDFVVMVPLANQDKTRVIGADDLNQIKKQTANVYIDPASIKIQEPVIDDDDEDDDDDDVPPPAQENAPEPLPGGMVVGGFFSSRVTIQRLDPAGVAESGIVPVFGSVKAGSVGVVQWLDPAVVAESSTDPMAGDAGEVLTPGGVVLIESAAPRSTVTTDISSLREDGVEDIFFRYEDTMTHYSVDKMADAAGEDADVELKQNREDISLRLDGETRDDLSERYLEWVPVQTPEPQERLILTHEGVEQKTSDELRRERDELLKQELDMMDFQLAKKRDDLPSLDWWLEPAREETPGIGLDESLKQLASRFEDIAPEEDKKPLLFPVKPTVTERKKYTNPLESDLRSYTDLGDDWDDLPDTQGEIKIWLPEDLGQPKEISISKESLSSIDGIA